ncbi:MAG: L-seryl-tRNA(Sec) selenium transferase [Verrucomicrobiota bacterium]|jgi:L-seryl-tRNA(Ser) seleniumtransferase|nr:L-seryl-tRNA(Sec) selenium transferase [Verrucomicrobiota bacterium]
MAGPRNNLRAIPGVDTILEAVTDCSLPRPLVVAVIRAELQMLRKSTCIPGLEKITATIRERLGDLALSRLQSVINGTGVVVHTNLGRSPINPLVTAGFVNLEMDLVTGRRGGRAGYLERCLAELCGAEAAMVVNNCAAALVLNLRHLTVKKKEVIVSRGELVQIGGGFRLPDILESSGAKLREIGATNHTTLNDYAGAIGSQTGLILKVHRSNFFMDGFVAAPKRRELTALARKKRVPFVEDLGSGVLLPTGDWAEGHHEPMPSEVLKEGADIVCFSGDKLMGGPQSGIIAGRARHVQALKKHPFFRALRCDKLVLSALQSTAEHYLHNQGGTLPLHRMLRADLASIQRRTRKLARALKGMPAKVCVTPGHSQVGGGALPQVPLPTVTLDIVPNDIRLTDFAARLRRATPPVIGVISGRRFRLDLRTILPDQEKSLMNSIRQNLVSK